MKKRVIFSVVATLMLTATATAQLDNRVFELLDLDRRELKEVKAAYRNGDNALAAERLLDYYRSRTSVRHPDLNLQKAKPSKADRKRADDGLKHIFYVHDGYKPYFYGDDIDWRYWPVKDNELRWQLHRTKWWLPMGKVYYDTKDETYAAEWTAQYLDWIAKNPLLKDNFFEDELVETSDADQENMRFAWRPLEVSDRIENQTQQFMLFAESESFTPEFLTQFLTNYYRHVKYLMANYSKQGNHLLFEAQRVIYAGTFFPEFKEAKEWRSNGVEILNREIGVQVYDDGMQFELDPHYHLAAIGIFLKGLKVMDVNGLRDEFPQSYIDTVEKMIAVYYNMCFPDYTNPTFGDAKIHKKSAALNDYRRWTPTFPADKMIRYLATEGKKGEIPDYYSRAFRTSGFYVMRNGWDMAATVMVLKAGPPAFWHNQPDNGTFELWRAGRNFFPDSGSYVYAGDAQTNAERAWFRQTRVHNTLTLDEADITTTDSKLRYWRADYTGDIVATTNPSYEGLEHTRTVFFPERKFFVIVDRASGSAAGEVELHYNLCPSEVVEDVAARSVATSFVDGNNIYLKVFCSEECTMRPTEGWYSDSYRNKVERPAYEFAADKKADATVRYITVIVPVTSADKAPRIEAEFVGRDKANAVNVLVTIDGREYSLRCKF